jgi:hypothetical protein
MGSQSCDFFVKSFSMRAHMYVSVMSSQSCDIANIFLLSTQVYNHLSRKGESEKPKD